MSKFVPEVVWEFLNGCNHQILREFEKLMDIFPGENFLSKTLITLPQFPNQKKNIILYQ